MRQYTIFHPLLLSFFSKSLYQDVGRNWKGITFLYLLLLLAVCWLPLMYKANVGLSEYIRNTSPKFIAQIPVTTITNGVVSVEGQQPITINDPENDKPLIIIDTTGQITSLEKSGASFLLTRTTLIAKKNARETRIISLAEIDNFYMDQDRAKHWIEKIRDWFAFILFPFALLGSFLYRIAQVIIYGLIGLVFAKITGTSLNYQTSLNLAIISITPVIILNTIKTILTISVPLWWLLCFVIAMGYLYFAVKVNKDSVITTE